MHGNAQQLPNNESNEYDKNLMNIKKEVVEVNTNSNEANNFNKIISFSSDLPINELSSCELPTFRKQKFQEQFGAISPLISQLKFGSCLKKNSNSEKDKC